MRADVTLQLASTEFVAMPRGDCSGDLQTRTARSRASSSSSFSSALPLCFSHRVAACLQLSFAGFSLLACPKVGCQPDIIGFVDLSAPSLPLSFSTEGRKSFVFINFSIRFCLFLTAAKLSVKLKVDILYFGLIVRKPSEPEIWRCHHQIEGGWTRLSRRGPPLSWMLSGL